MIKAIIRYKENNTLVIDIPREIYDLYEKLMSIGIHRLPRDVKLTDEEGDDIQVKLYAENDMGNHLILLMNEKNSLWDANIAAQVVVNAEDAIKTELEQNIVHDQYDSLNELYKDIKTRIMISSFYFPLTKGWTIMSVRICLMKID